MSDRVAMEPSPDDGDYAVTVRELTKRYGDKTVVNHVSFQVRRGEIFALLGPNGAGKTTIIRMLTTVASITEGIATVTGRDVKTNAQAVRSAIGVVPQEVTLDNELKGVENVLIAAKLHHIPERVARARARDLLQLVELDSVSENGVGTYSGGMKRRLQLVMALIHKPQIVFLDEPTVGLDVQTRIRIWDYLRRLNKEDRLTILMTTHYLEEADQLAHKIAIMDHATITVLGTPTQLKESLHGDILTLEMEDGVDITELLKNTKDVLEVTRSGQAYRMKVSNVETALPTVISDIARKGLKIKATAFNKPTLDEVFLEVTGRSMRDEEEGNNPDQKQEVKEEVK